MKASKPFCLYALVATSVCVCGASAHAQQALPEVTVQADAQQEIVITDETLQRHQARGMAEIFVAEPSVFIGGGARNAQRLYLRGVEGSNLNISIDGASLGRNLHQHRGGIGGMDPELLKRVRVNAGPGADRGPSALGGSIQFETVDAQDLLASGQAVGLRVKGSYGSASESRRGSTTVYGLAAGKLGLLGHISAENAQDYRRGGGGDVPNSAGRDRNYFLKLSLLEQSGHNLRLSAEKNANSGLYLWGSTGSDMGYAPDGSVPVYQKTERKTYILNHNYRQTDNPWIDWKFNLYRNDEALENVTSNSSMQGEKTGADVRNTLHFTFGPTQHSLSVGADWFTEDLKGTSFLNASVTNTSRNHALYVQDRIGIGPVALSLGVRHDDFDADYGPYRFSGNATSPNAGADVELGRGFTAFAGYGEAVRGSGLIPGSWMSNITDNTVINNGQPLQPERSRQREAGLRYAGHDWLRSNDRFHAALTLYKLYLYDTIERVGGGGGEVSTIRNNPDTLISRGIDLRVSWNSGGYQTNMGYSKVRSEDQNGNPVGINRRRNAPTGDRFVWDHAWQINSEWQLGYTMNLVKRLQRVPANQIERPGYGLHDVHVTWQPSGTSGLMVTLGINNLMDKKYSNQTSIAAGTDNIVHEPGRDIRLSASYQF